MSLDVRIRGIHALNIKSAEKLRCSNPQPLVGSLTYTQIMSLAAALVETLIDSFQTEIARWTPPETEPSIVQEK
jgi:hypothetical protein